LVFCQNWQILKFQKPLGWKFFLNKILGLGNIGPNIKFGGLVFKNKKVVTRCAKMGGALWQRKAPTKWMEIFLKQDLEGWAILSQYPIANP
jgi:hypothetical protein